MLVVLVESSNETDGFVVYIYERSIKTAKIIVNDIFG